ncbi:hypothetical protein ACFC18_45515 [Streptomyces sp. NPDC056121]|uniref:hypothetical protein n=1 Tax=Streptomyces sp. NPDC056121 TaxID=3345718 RepID=UPI0035D9BC4C
MDIVTRIRSQWDRLTAAVTALAGAAILVVGWRGVSGTPYPAEQLPYVVSAGLGSLFLLGISTALWLSADLRDEWRKLDRIEQALRAAGGVDGAALAGDRQDNGAVVASPARERTASLSPGSAASPAEPERSAPILPGEEEVR